MRVPDIAATAFYAGNELAPNVADSLRPSSLQTAGRYGPIERHEPTHDLKYESSPEQLEYLSLDEFVQKALTSCGSYKASGEPAVDNYQRQKTECDRNCEFVNGDVGYESGLSIYRRDSLNDDYYCNNANAASPLKSSDILNENKAYGEDEYSEEHGHLDDNVNNESAADSGHSSTSYYGYFPRGIINPNYPGFQHLAHTLTEHFDNGMFFDSGESSEVSEYEMDLSGDSCCDDDHCEQNNNSLMEEDQDLELVYEVDGNPAETLPVEESVDQRNENEAQRMPGQASKTRLGYDKQKLDLSLKLGMKQGSASLTPDILIENSHGVKQVTANKRENRPDLLREVSSPFDGRVTLAGLPPSMGRCRSKTEIPMGLTPDIDIIGDFGEEVEREFGLLVSGYRKLSMTGDSDDSDDSAKEFSKTSDAALSGATDQIDSTKYLAKLNRAYDDDGDEDDDVDDTKQYEGDSPAQTTTSPNPHTPKTPVQGRPENREESPSPEEPPDSATEPHEPQPGDPQQKPKYQKSSYDDRQLPPVAIEYKRCQQPVSKTPRKAEKPPRPATKSHKGHNLMHRLWHKKTAAAASSSSYSLAGASGHSKRRQPEEEEIYQYRQLMSDKESILCNSKYTKLSSWAQYVKDSVKERGAHDKTTELISPSALDLFDAYKIGTEIDMETLQRNFRMAKEIERKRRNDREEIHRRLAMDTEDNAKYVKTKDHFKHNIQSKLQSMDGYSDTESHSSDSETCPKLSNKMKNNKFALIGMPIHAKREVAAVKARDQGEVAADEDKECDFFTQQARFQIEARMALAQAKNMAQMQMEIERQKQRVSPITMVIRDSMEKVGVRLTPEKRRVSRLMLTEMNIAQLQVLVNSLHNHIEDLNEVLMRFLIERDDLHLRQDVMLGEVEELTRYIGAQETISTQNRKEQILNKRIV